jgi:hypothetical protein
MQVEIEPVQEQESESRYEKNISSSLNVLSPQKKAVGPVEIRMSTLDFKPIVFIEQVAQENRLKREEEGRKVEEDFDDMTLFPGYSFKHHDSSEINITQPGAMLANMTSEQLQEFRGEVITKYGKDGRSRNDKAPKERRAEAKRYDQLHVRVRVFVNQFNFLG